MAREPGRDPVTPRSDATTTRPTVVRAEEPRRRGPDTVVQTATFSAPRDSVRWGAIVAGLITTIGLFLLLSLLALGFGLAAVTTVEGSAPVDIASTSGIVAAIIGLFSFFVGGWVAGRTGAAVGAAAGAFNGFLVWALSLLLILWLGVSGLGALFGAAGDIFATLPPTAVPDPGTVDPNVQVDPSAAAEAVRNSAFVAFFSLGLPALAAIIGGAVGVRHEAPADRATD